MPSANIENNTQIVTLDSSHFPCLGFPKGSPWCHWNTGWWLVGRCLIPAGVWSFYNVNRQRPHKGLTYRREDRRTTDGQTDRLTDWLTDRLMDGMANSNEDKLHVWSNILNWPLKSRQTGLTYYDRNSYVFKTLLSKPRKWPPDEQIIRKLLTNT